MASRNYYSVPSSKTKKIISAKKNIGRPLTIRETEKDIIRIREAKRIKRENKKKYFQNKKKSNKIKKRKYHYKENYLTSLGILSEFAFKHPNMYPKIIATMNKSFPSHSTKDYSEIFVTYSELITGNEISNIIDSEIFEFLIRLIIKKNSSRNLKQTLLSLKHFYKKNRCHPQLIKTLNEKCASVKLSIRF